MEKKKKNKLNKEVVKSLIFKALHIIGYFSTALLIILAIAMGVNSCNANKKRSSAVRNTENDISERIELDNPTSYTHYWSRFYGVNFLSNVYTTFTLDEDTQRTLWEESVGTPFVERAVVIPTGETAPSDIVIEDVKDGLFVITENNDYYSVQSVRIYWHSYFSGTVQGNDFYFYTLESVRIRMIGVGGSYYNMRPIRNYGSSWNEYDKYRAYGLSTDYPLDAPYYNWYRNIFATRLGVQLPSWFTYFYQDYNKVITSSFDTFNPNGLVGFSSDNSVFFTTQWTGTTYDYTLINDSGFIISNGKIFDRITLHYVKLATGGVYADNSQSSGYSSVSGTSYTWYFDSMNFNNSAYSDNDVRVCYRAYHVYGNSSGPSYQIIWNDSGYKQVYYYALTQLAFEGASEGFQSLGTLTPRTAGNIFDLLTSAFSSVIPVFNQTLIPGFTIGTLLAIPLIGMVVFALVKLLKK